MRSKADIKAQIARIKADPRYSYPPASTFANAPLALIQVELKGQVAALRWAAGLDEEMGTSAKPARPKKKRSAS